MKDGREILSEVIHSLQRLSLREKIDSDVQKGIEISLQEVYKIQKREEAMTFDADITHW